MPTPEEFRRMLREASENYDPLEELLALERELFAFEQKYGLSSEEFYSRFMQGAMGDDMEVIEWAGTYELFLHLKAAISESLKLVVAGPITVH
jgi:hypothetical protein